MRFFFITCLLIVFAGITAAENPVDSQPALDLQVDAKVCDTIVDRMPINPATEYSADVHQVWLWSKITGAQDTIAIKHVWSYKGEDIWTTEIDVKSSSWRAFSYKTIPSDWTGKWEARVVGPDGTVMATIPFTVGEDLKSR